jgi:predicted GNAT family acetyltransferase
VDVERVADPETFLNRAGEFLLADEARHNLMFGIVHSIAHYPGIYPEWNLWVVDRAGHTVGVAVRTPPQNLVIARPAAEEVLDALADALAEHDAALPGVTAAQPEVDDFAHGWVARAGGSVRRRMVQGIYSLDAVNDVPTAVGRARVAGPSDFDEMLQLIEEFQREIGVEWSRDDDRARRALEGRLDDSAESGLWVWEAAGRTVSLSGYHAATPTGARIGPVYTPPAERGHGYASNLVSEQSRWLLSTGRRFCFLYTDLANPTSNAIYRRIGYRQVCESAELMFEP